MVSYQGYNWGNPQEGFAQPLLESLGYRPRCQQSSPTNSTRAADGSLFARFVVAAAQYGRPTAYSHTYDAPRSAVDFNPAFPSDRSLRARSGFYYRGLDRVLLHVFVSIEKITSDF
jgi:hypothetical protein